MTTYNSYAEAKIANPESEIYNDTKGKFQAIKDAPTSHFANGWELCKPQNYCMTVERFLADGHKFVCGDIVIDAGEVSVIDVVFDRDVYNKPDIGDEKIYILCAAALEKKPKQTKFVKVEESIFDLKGEFERGELHTKGRGAGGNFFRSITTESELITLASCGLYRKVEIDWRDEVKKLNESAIFHDDGDLFLIIDSNSKDFISMCHEIALLTEKPTN